MRLIERTCVSNLNRGAPLVSPASLQHLGLLGTASVWAAHLFNDRQVWSCWSCCRRNLSAAYSHYQQPCVKEPSVDNFREAMHGDAARTAALLEMGARRSPCSTVHRLRRRVCAPQDRKGRCVSDSCAILTVRCSLLSACAAAARGRAVRCAPRRCSASAVHPSRR